MASEYELLTLYNIIIATFTTLTKNVFSYSLLEHAKSHFTKRRKRFIITACARIYGPQKLVNSVRTEITLLPAALDEA